VGINHGGVSDAGVLPIVLDPETGAAGPCTLPDSEGLDLLGFSPWRDANGQSHLVALDRHGEGEPTGDEDRDASFLLTRYTYPAGQVLGRVPLGVLPGGPACWLPDRSDRILFVGADWRLYCQDLREGPRGRSPAPVPPRPLRWQGRSPSGVPARFQDACWPAASVLGGRLLVSAYPGQDAPTPGRGPRLWWLRVDPDRATIKAAGRLIVGDGDGGQALEHEEERTPCVGTASDGTPLLAYLARTHGGSTWDLYVAPITSTAPNRAPRVLHAARRKLAEGCLGTTLAFSADGRTVLASTRDPGHPSAAGVTLRRCPLPASLSPF
jgi:hypothetical protein